MESIVAISIVVVAVTLLGFFSFHSNRKGGCKCGDGSGSCKNDSDGHR